MRPLPSVNAIATVALLMLLPSPAKPDGFTETFDSGSAVFTANDPYWLNNSLYNGLIIQSTVVTGYFGTGITHDASGQGYFLFEGTGSYTETSNDIPAGHGEFYISPVFAVTPETEYDVSFDLVNDGSLNVASIEAGIGGQVFGPVSANGQFNDGNPLDQWQLFSFEWNSGTSTTASVILNDLTPTDSGDDFAIDNISVASTPEPTTLSMSLIGLVVVVASRHRLPTRAGRNCGIVETIDGACESEQ
jgi:hypothetical protein